MKYDQTGAGPAGRSTPFTTARRLLRATFKSAETQVHAMPKSKPKLPGSTVTAPLKFEESEGFWASVEERTGPFKQKRRERIRHIIDSYFARAQFEANATDLALADKTLADIRKTTTAFRKTLTAQPSGEGAIEAHIHVEHVLDSILRQSTRLSVFLGPPVVPDSQILKQPQSRRVACGARGSGPSQRERKLRRLRLHLTTPSAIGYPSRPRGTVRIR